MGKLYENIKETYADIIIIIKEDREFKESYEQLKELKDSEFQLDFETYAKVVKTYQERYLLAYSAFYEH